MQFEDKLNDQLTKERGGRHGGKGHEFQRYWTLCHILKIDTERDDYVVLMEFIEDVAVIDSELTPAYIDLFQLKKNEGSGGKWTKTSLLATKKLAKEDGGDGIKKGKSILAKLHESRSVVKSETRSISFVSNAPVDLRLGDGGSDSIDRQEFTGSLIAGDVQASLKDSIAKELACSASDISFDDWIFVKSPLAMDDLEGHAIGRVASYLANKFPDYSPRADVLCKALYSEIKIRATATLEASSFSDLKKIRGISKKQFSEMLAATISRRSDTAIMDEILAGLTMEGVSFARRMEIKKELRRFVVDKAGKNTVILDSLLRSVQLSLEKIPNDLCASWDVANWIADDVIKNDGTGRLSAFERPYLVAVALYKANQ